MKEFKITGHRTTEMEVTVDSDQIERILLAGSMDMYTLVESVRRNFLNECNINPNSHLESEKWVTIDSSWYGKTVHRDATLHEITAWSALNDFASARTAIALAKQDDENTGR